MMGVAQGDLSVPVVKGTNALLCLVNPNPPACLTSSDNTALGSSLPPFVEQFYGNTWKPRLSVGFGVNWNSPFGPFRIDIAYPLLNGQHVDSSDKTQPLGRRL